MKELIKEHFGTLIKQEKLSCIESGLLLEDTCVLESISPFYGYYNIAAPGAKPLYLYLMLSENHCFDELHTAIFNAEKKADFRFDAVKGFISILGMPVVSTIRVRSLESYNRIAELQRLLKNEGVRFKKQSRDFENLPGMIHLEKFFFVEEWGSGMYVDHRVAHHGYFEIPVSMKWENFKDLTKQVRYGKGLPFFDAAIVRFYSGLGYTNLVRIYKEQLERSQLETIKNRYLELIGKTIIKI